MDFETKFYKDLNDRLDKIEGKLDDIQSKVIYMYSFAAVIGLGASFFVDYLRTKLFGAH